MGNSFEDGQKAGQRLLKLLADLGGSDPIRPAPSKKVEKVLNTIWAWSSAGEPHPAAVGFFSTVLPDSSHDSNLLHLWGIDQFLHEQESSAPICNIPKDSGIFAFADWTGESDGDAWCYDIQYECLRCIPVSSGEKDADKSRLQSYGVSSPIWLFSRLLALRSRVAWVATVEIVPSQIGHPRSGRAIGKLGIADPHKWDSMLSSARRNQKSGLIG